MAQEKKERIFISYKRVDKERVFAIKDGIERATGEKCWIDLDGIESDAQFANVIIKAINRCEVFLFMYSKEHAKISDFEEDWTIKEITFAKEKKKRIVIINIDDTPLIDQFLFEFPRKQRIDASNESALNRLYKDLCSWLNIDASEIRQQAESAKKAQVNSKQLKGDADKTVSIGSVHELVALGAKLGSDGVPEELQEQFVNDLVKTKRLATAQNNLGFHLSDTEKRIKYLEEAAQNGSGAALINLAHIYEYGEGVERDIDKAIDYYRTAIVHHGHTEFVDDIRALIKEKESKAKEAKSLAEEKAIKKNHQLGTIIESIQSIKGNDNSKTFDIILKSAGACKLQVVKIIKEQTGLDLKESKDIVDAAPSYIKRNVNKEIAVAIKKELDEVGAFVELYENSKTFDVILKSAGACKFQVVKIIKEQTGLGLKESKDIVDAAPSYITRNVDRVMAETIKKELEKVGASVEIR